MSPAGARRADRQPVARAFSRGAHGAAGRTVGRADATISPMAISQFDAAYRVIGRFALAAASKTLFTCRRHCLANARGRFRI